MAIVTDARWAGPAIKVFSVLWPGKARAFPLAELDAAKRRAADDTARPTAIADGSSDEKERRLREHHAMQAGGIRARILVRPVTADRRPE